MRDANWNHAVCRGCLARLLRPRPIRIVTGEREVCCYCGQDTDAGFYMYQDPKLTPCQGGVGPATLLPQRP